MGNRIMNKELCGMGIEKTKNLRLKTKSTKGITSTSIKSIMGIGIGKMGNGIWVVRSGIQSNK